MRHMQPDIKSYAEQVVRGRTGRDVDEHLRELYVDRRFTDWEIAAILGVSRQTVTNWRRKYGIGRADRKAALA